MRFVRFHEPQRDPVVGRAAELVVAVAVVVVVGTVLVVVGLAVVRVVIVGVVVVIVGVVVVVVGVVVVVDGEAVVVVDEEAVVVAGAVLVILGKRAVTGVGEVRTVVVCLLIPGATIAMVVVPESARNRNATALFLNLVLAQDVPKWLQYLLLK